MRLEFSTLLVRSESPGALRLQPDTPKASDLAPWFL